MRDIGTTDTFADRAATSVLVSEPMGEAAHETAGPVVVIEPPRRCHGVVAMLG
jgi:hypothetical protein